MFCSIACHKTFNGSAEPVAIHVEFKPAKSSYISVEILKQSRYD